MSESLETLEKSYEDGEIIFCEYEKGDSFYFIKSGKIKLIRQNKGEETILDVLNPGAFFGEMAIIDTELRTASAIAFGPVVLIRFSRDNFESLVLQNTTLTLKLIRTFVSRIWSQQQRLYVFKLKEHEPRIIAMLLNLKTDNTDLTIHVNANMEDISQWAGVPLPGTKKVLQSLVNSHIITVQSDKIIVNDLPALNRVFSVYQHQSNN